MDAAQRFNELLSQIENSKLNYVISRTSYSANISVKKSLIKIHDQVSEKKEIQVKEENQTNENGVFKTKIDNLLEQNAAIKELLKEKSIKVETLESGLASLQQELLKEKKKKKELACKIKTHQKDLGELNQVLMMRLA